MKNKFDCDVVIVGGGLVGSSLAYTLSKLPLKIIIVELADPENLEQPSFDSRSTAISKGSQKILSGIGIWEQLEGNIEPIESIHISEKGHFGYSNILSSEEGVSALGYTVENRFLGKVLWDQIKKTKNINFFAPATLLNTNLSKNSVEVLISSNNKENIITSKVIVAADGVNSKVREILNIEFKKDLYFQKAVVANCATELPHSGQAFERFSPGGPLAILPLSNQRVGIVWTLPEKEAEELMKLNKKFFIDRLQDAFGQRLGKITKIGKRFSYPLFRLKTSKIVGNRSVIIGSAAVHLHPIAAQGFNLALRDIASLAEVFSQNLNADIGSKTVLSSYQDWRDSDQSKVSFLTHGLINLFGINSKKLGLLRGLSLLTFDIVPGAKKIFSKHMMGLSGKMSRLARGLPLLEKNNS